MGKLTAAFVVMLMALTATSSIAQQSPTLGIDIHDCAEGSDEDLANPPYTPVPATS